MLVGQGQILVLIVILVVGMIFGVAVAWWIAGSRKSNAPEPGRRQFSPTAPPVFGTGQPVARTEIRKVGLAWWGIR